MNVWSRRLGHFVATLWQFILIPHDAKHIFERTHAIGGQHSISDASLDIARNTKVAPPLKFLCPSNLHRPTEVNPVTMRDLIYARSADSKLTRYIDTLHTFSGHLSDFCC
jgi:hypothetical protein